MYQPKKRSNGFLNLPEKFTMYENTARGPDRWWNSFNSRELNTLIDMALQNNLTIAETYARVEQAWAVAVKQGAARWPGLSATADSSVSRSRKAGTDGKKTRQSYGLGLSASYEVDLWGRISSIQKSARLDLEAAHEDLYTSAVTLSSEVALAWLDLIATSKKIELLKKQLKTNETMLQLTMFRYRKGQSSALDVFQQRQTVARTKALFPQLESNFQILKHELAFFVGRPSKFKLGLKSVDFPDMPKMPQSGIPADLLAKRPDVRKAGLRLKSADWIVSSAKADRLPALRLTASYSYGSDNVTSIFDNWIANLAAGITGPIFDGGTRKAEVRRTMAVVKERIATYKKTVLTAVREVEDSLVKEKKQQDYISALNEQYNATVNTYNQALEYYRKGKTGYINVLESLNASQSLELNLVDAEYLYYQYRIGLYRSLGGSWMRKDMKLNIKE